MERSEMTKPKRWRLRFSVRTMVVVWLVVALVVIAIVDQLRCDQCGELVTGHLDRAFHDFSHELDELMRRHPQKQGIVPPIVD